MRHLTRMSRNLSRWGGGFTYLYLSLMLLCFSAIGVKAADTDGSVKINSDVHSSQWAIDSQLHDSYGNRMKFSNENDGNNGGSAKSVSLSGTRASAVATANSNVASGDFFSATVVPNKTYSLESGQDLELSVEHATIEGGKVLIHNGHQTNSADVIGIQEGFNLANSQYTYMKVTLEHPLAVGDVISVPYPTDLYLTKDSKKATDINLKNGSYTITEGSTFVGRTVFYLWQGKFKTIKIKRAVIFSATAVSTPTLTLDPETGKDLTSAEATIVGGTVYIYNGNTTSSSADVIGGTTGFNLNDSKASYVKVSLTQPLAEGDVISAKVTNATKPLYLTTTDGGFNETDINLTENDYTIPAGSPLLKDPNVFYLWNGQFTTIKVTRVVPLNIVTTGVTMNTIDAEETQPTIKVYDSEGNPLTLDTDYTLSYQVKSGSNVTVVDGKLKVGGKAYAWSEGTSVITVTATPTDKLSDSYRANSYDFEFNVVKGKSKPVFLSSFQKITINLQPGKSKTIAVPLIYNGEDVSSYFKYTYTIDPEISGSTVDGSKLTFTTPSATGKYTVKVNAEATTIDGVNYGDVYDTPAEISFILNVDSKYQAISVTTDPQTIEMTAGTTAVAPKLTVAKDTQTLTGYTTSWFSTSPGIVRVNAETGAIDAISEGTAEVRVVVSGDNLESTTAIIKVVVDDPVMYRVKAPDVEKDYTSQKRMWNQDKTMSVVLGGWLFPSSATTDAPYITTLSSEKKWGVEAKDATGNEIRVSSKAKWKLKGFGYYVAGDGNDNARQENGSNALPETTNIYGKTFSKDDTGTIKDQMFNVPCHGSFLEFNPVTNGKVTVHILQNGAFDTSKGKSSYRPQRRVFIMDEAGNFVSSDAHIESTTGLPTGGLQNLTAYKFNLKNDEVPSIAEVRSHFKGISEDFEMTEGKYYNSVYESGLDQELVPNEAAKKHPNLKGSHGWAVIADSPVTYTFNVKAGKSYYLYNYGSKIGFYGFSFDEDETKPTVDVKEYDAETANVNNVVEKTPDGHVAQVKIARKMVANRWTTCVLPFSLNRQQVDAIFGPAYSAANPEGTQILYFDHVEGSKAYFVRHAYNTIVAGKPFLIKPTKEVTSINTADVKDYPYVTIENTKPDDWCKSNGYVWTSSYNTMNIVKNDYFIGASDGKFKAYSGDSGTVKGFRGFLKADHSAGAKPTMLSISTSSITDGNDGETTGIEDLIITADGELMPANSRVYNINGQLVSEDASNF